MAMDGLLSLRWNNHSSSFLKQLSFLRDQETYSDLTLVCGGQFYQVHKLVVSGCSEYFRAILQHTPCKHPAVVLQDLPPRHLEALLSYMYLGHVSVPQEQLGGLIKAAECLAIKGLAVPDEDTPSPTRTPPPQKESKSRPAPAWDSGQPNPKRRRQERDEARSSYGPQPCREDSNRARRDSTTGGRGSPILATSSSPPYQNASPEDTIAVKEDVENLPEVKTEVPDTMFDLPDPCEDMIQQEEEPGNEEDVEVIYSPPHTTTNSLMHQYPSQQQPQPQSFEEVVSEALPGPSGVAEESGWSKGDLTSPVAQPFMMESYTPQQESLTPVHHTLLHQRGPGLAEWANQGSHTQPDYTTHSHSTQPWSTPPQATSGGGGANSGGGGGGVLPDRRCCQICGYKGQDVAQLRKHLRIHTGEKPFRCSACSYSSTQSSNLKVHIRRHHPHLIMMEHVTLSSGGGSGGGDGVGDGSASGVTPPVQAQQAQAAMLSQTQSSPGYDW